MATALDLANDAYTLIGVKAAGDTLSPSMGQYALSQINRIVSSWLPQPLLQLTASVRTIFNLTANQQTYFIGPGAQLNADRPQAITSAALLLNGLASPVTVISLTRAGHVATVTATAHGFAPTEQVYVYAQTGDSAWNGVQTIATVPTANTFTFPILDMPASPATGVVTIQAFQSLNSQVEIPIAILTDDAYESIQVKGMSNSQFTQLYYQPTQPWGTIYLWPMPNTGANQLVVYLESQFTGFATLSRDYTFPETAGYYDLLQFSLAERLLFSFPGQADADAIRAEARKAKAIVKRQNYTIHDAPSDAAAAVGADRRFGYNIQTGNY